MTNEPKLKLNTRIEHEEGCVFIYGPMPVRDFAIVLGKLPKEAVIDADLARMVGASFACGLSGALQHLREKHSQTYREEIVLRFKDLGLSEPALHWLAIGEQGQSSLALFGWLSGLDMQTDPLAHPHDPGDFRRCRLLLDAVPEFRSSLDRMRQVSLAWGEIIEHWEELCAAMDAEVPDWRTHNGAAPETYKIMTAILPAAQARAA